MESWIDAAELSGYKINEYPTVREERPDKHSQREILHIDKTLKYIHRLGLSQAHCLLSSTKPYFFAGALRSTFSDHRVSRHILLELQAFPNF